MSLLELVNLTMYQMSPKELGQVIMADIYTRTEALIGKEKIEKLKNIVVPY